MAEIYHFAPASITDNSDNFAEIITVSESGYEHRRLKASRPLMSCTFNYIHQSRGQRYSIASFLRDRSGPHEWFYLPSYMHDTNVSVNYTAGTSLTVADSTPFSEALAIGRNFLFILNSDGEYEVRQFTSVPSGTSIIMASALTYDYPVGSEVDICYRARLDADSFSMQDLSYYKHNFSIPFREVK